MEVILRHLTRKAVFGLQSHLPLSSFLEHPFRSYPSVQSPYLISQDAGCFCHLCLYDNRIITIFEDITV